MPDYFDDFIPQPPEEPTIPSPEPIPEPQPHTDDYDDTIATDDTSTEIFLSEDIPTNYKFLLTLTYNNVTYESATVEMLQDAGVPEANIIAAAKEYLKRQCRSFVHDHIVQYMPEWRQIKWRNYMTIYEKEQDGKTLSSVEQDVVKQMTESDSPTQQDKDDAYQMCLDALGWINGCVFACDGKESELNALSTLQDLNNFDPFDITFPNWPL